MSDFKIFRDGISNNKNELIIYAADNFSQFPQRDLSVSSKCDRALPAAMSALSKNILNQQRAIVDIKKIILIQIVFNFMQKEIIQVVSLDISFSSIKIVFLILVIYFHKFHPSVPLYPANVCCSGIE